jgi:hypothetical protein
MTPKASWEMEVASRLQLRPPTWSSELQPKLLLRALGCIPQPHFHSRDHSVSPCSSSCSAVESGGSQGGPLAVLAPSLHCSNCMSSALPETLDDLACGLFPWSATWQEVPASLQIPCSPVHSPISLELSHSSLHLRKLPVQFKNTHI